MIDRISRARPRIVRFCALSGLLAMLVCNIADAESGVGLIPIWPANSDFFMPVDARPTADGESAELIEIALTGHGVSRPSGFQQACYTYPRVARRWHPATGIYSNTPLGMYGSVYAQVTAPLGVFFLISGRCQGDEPSNIILLMKSGKIVKADSAHEFAQPRLTALSDGAIAVLDRDKATRRMSAYVVRLQGNILKVEQMPDFPFAVNNDYAETALADGRLMVLGGSADPYRGCNSCRAETWFLDPKSKAWSNGPRMLEPRSEASATNLRDGSILVTGGWTPSQQWGHGPSRTAERWNPSSNTFESIAPMPSGSARHRGIWLPGQEGKTLLVAGGTNPSIQAFDVTSRTWTTVGATGYGHNDGAWPIVPFVLEGQAFAWVMQLDSAKPWELVPLRLPRTIPNAVLYKGDLITHRAHSAFIAATEDAPALIIGGDIDAGTSYLLSSAVDTVDKKLGMLPLQPLNEPRSYAMGFRVGKGVIVVGGLAGDDHDRNTSHSVLPTEWLPAGTPGEKKQWIKLSGPGVAQTSAVGQLPDESLLVLEGNSISHLKLKQNSTDAPALEQTQWSQLNRLRTSSGDDRVQIRGFRDGRVIVAGGVVQTDKIALLKPDSERNDSVDDYVGIGQSLPSRRHEIYDPTSKSWHSSSPSREPGGQVVILDDGRVVKMGCLPWASIDAAHCFIETSSADGMSWSTLPTPEINLARTFTTVVVDGELFLGGDRGQVGAGGGERGVEWFNTEKNQWELLWGAEPSNGWRDDTGHVIVSHLANGKTIVLPIGEF